MTNTEKPWESWIEALQRDLAAAADVTACDRIKTQHLGPKSPVRQALRTIKDRPPATQKAFAQAVNQAAQAMEAQWTAAKQALQQQAMDTQMAQEWIDTTLPSTRPPVGRWHPVHTMATRCLRALVQWGFTVHEGRETETAYYNFDALNIPEHHPARDLQDTFWLGPDTVLRTHTTAAQVRLLANSPPLPIKCVVMGRVYRNEAVDATHLAMFHQLDGFWVAPELTFSHLLGILAQLARALYGPTVRFRFKPKYYPYTEPSVGMDIACTVCAGAGCSACHHAGWITVMGAGMIHPTVLRTCGYDPQQVSGLAFGWGLSRLTAQFFQLPKLRPLYSGDLRYLQAVPRTTP